MSQFWLSRFEASGSMLIDAAPVHLLTAAFKRFGAMGGVLFRRARWDRSGLTVEVFFGLARNLD